MKIMMTGDWHIRSKNPVNRIGSYPDDIKAKLNFLLDVAKNDAEVECILVTGDIFDNPIMALSTIFMAYNILKETPVPIITVPGNHDVFGYNLESWKDSALYMLQLLLPEKLKVLLPEHVYRLENIYNLEPIVEVTGQGYVDALDEDDSFGYSPRTPVAANAINIHIVHGMLMDHECPFKHTLVKNVETTANIILSGHDHVGYGIINRKSDGVRFINPGSIIRSSISEVGRQPKYVIYNTVENTMVEYALPMFEDRFDLDKYEDWKDDKTALDSFSDVLIKLRSFERVSVKDTLTDFTKVKEVTPEVVDIIKKAVEQAEYNKSIGR